MERPNPRTGANDIVLVNLLRGAIESRLTVNPASDTRSVWVPVTNLIAYGSNRTAGFYDLCAKPADGAGDEDVLYASPESKFPTGASPDGRLLFFERTAPRAKTELWALSMEDRKVFPLLESGFNEAQARMSPDGRWIAFVSDREGSAEVYVVEASGVISTDAAARRRAAASSLRVSTNGGTQPLWRRDRKQTELYFLARDRRLMAVGFTEGPRPVGTPIALFETRATDLDRTTQSYAAARDGQRFLFLVRAEENRAATIVLNWSAMLQK
jgi:dipeptidyl aminopeptidase/acylaminoacyl peptidase